MRYLLALLLLSLLFNAVAAQTSEPPTPQELAERAERAAERAESAAEAIQREAGDTRDLLSILDQLSSIFQIGGILAAIIVGAVGLLGTVAGVFGLSRYLSATQRLSAVREELLITEQRLHTAQQELQGIMQHGSDALLALALLPLGERQYKSRDLVGALKWYQQAHDLDADNPLIHYRLGYIYTQCDNLDAAQEHLNQALKLRADFPPALAALGYVQRSRAEKLPKANNERALLMAEAETTLLRALNASPQLVDDDGQSWWGLLGSLYRQTERYSEALDAYQQAAAVTPHSSYPISNLALLATLTGASDRAQSHYGQVEKLAQRNIQAEANDFWAYADLFIARLMLGRDDPDEALAAFLSTAPDNSTDALRKPLATLVQLESAFKARFPERAAEFDGYAAQIQSQIDAAQGEH